MDLFAKVCYNVRSGVCGNAERLTAFCTGAISTEKASGY